MSPALPARIARGVANRVAGRAPSCACAARSCTTTRPSPSSAPRAPRCARRRFRPSTCTTTWGAGSPATAPGSRPTSTALLAAMDQLGLAAMVNLDGRWDAELEANLDRYDRRPPGRFAHVLPRRLVPVAGPRRLGPPGRAARRVGGRRGARRRQGLEGPRAVRPRRRRRPRRARRPAAARRVGDRRRAGAAGAGARGRPRRLLVAGRPPQRALRGADPPPRLAPRLAPVPGTGRCWTRLEALVAAHRARRSSARTSRASAEDLGRAGAHARPATPTWSVDPVGARGRAGPPAPRDGRVPLPRHRERVLWGTDSFPLAPPAVPHVVPAAGDRGRALPLRLRDRPGAGPLERSTVSTSTSRSCAPLYAGNARRVVPGLSPPPEGAS